MHHPRLGHPTGRSCKGQAAGVGRGGRPASARPSLFSHTAPAQDETMRREIKDIVFRVISHTTDLLDQLGRGERLDLEAERAALKGLLNPRRKGLPPDDYYGEGQA